MKISYYYFTPQTSIEVWWKAPTQPNGAILGYKIVYTPPGANVTVDGASKLSHVITGLGGFYRDGLL